MSLTSIRIGHVQARLPGPAKSETYNSALQQVVFQVRQFPAPGLCWAFCRHGRGFPAPGLATQAGSRQRSERWNHQSVSHPAAPYSAVVGGDAVSDHLAAWIWAAAGGTAQYPDGSGARRPVPLPATAGVWWAAWRYFWRLQRALGLKFDLHLRREKCSFFQAGFFTALSPIWQKTKAEVETELL